MQACKFVKWDPEEILGCIGAFLVDGEEAVVGRSFNPFTAMMSFENDQQKSEM